MKRALYIKFLITYLIIGIVGFVVISTIGSYLVEGKVEERISQQLSGSQQYRPKSG